MSLKNIYQQLFDPVDKIFAFLLVLFHQSNLFDTYDKFTLFQYFGQRPFSRKKHALEYQLHSLCSTILNLFSANSKWWNRDYVVDTKTHVSTNSKWWNRDYVVDTKVHVFLEKGLWPKY